MMTEAQRRAVYDSVRAKFGTGARLNEDDAPDPEPMMPEDLETPDFSQHPTPAPTSPASAEETYSPLADLRSAQDQDRTSQTAANIMNAGAGINSAITGSEQVHYGADDEAARAKSRAQTVRDYLLTKQRRNYMGAMQTRMETPKAPPVMQAPKDVPMKAPPIANIKEPAVARKSQTAQKAPHLRDLPAGEAAQIGELQTADHMAKDLGDAFGDSKSLASFALKYLPGTKAASYGDVKLAAAQMIGTIMEGGKLTDSDLQDKYLRLVPDQTDGKERAQAKIATLRRMLSLKREGRLAGFKGAKFDVSGYDAPADATSDELVPMLSPKGQQVMVPKSRVQAALAAGGKLP